MACDTDPDRFRMRTSARLCNARVCLIQSERLQMNRVHKPSLPATTMHDPAPRRAKQVNGVHTLSRPWSLRNGVVTAWREGAPYGSGRQGSWGLKCSYTARETARIRRCPSLSAS